MLEQFIFSSSISFVHPLESYMLFYSKELANFHRPKALWYPHDNKVAVREQGKLPTKGPMKIIVKSLGGKGCKLHVDAEETISSVKAKASKKLGCHLSFGIVMCSLCSICYQLLFTFPKNLLNLKS